MSNENSWKSATESVDKMLKENNDFLSSIQDMSNSGKPKSEIKSDLRAQPLKKEEHKIEPEFLRTNAHTIQHQLDDIDLVKFAESKIEVSQQYEHFRANHAFSTKRDFGDIAIDGPKTSAESTLLTAATTFLSPNEFKDAVTTGKSASDVSKMVDSSKSKQITDTLLREHLKDKQEEINEPKKEKEPEPISRSFGVLDSMQKDLNKSPIVDTSIDDVKGPDDTPNAAKPKSSKAIGPK